MESQVPIFISIQVMLEFGGRGGEVGRLRISPTSYLNGTRELEQQLHQWKNRHKSWKMGRMLKKATWYLFIVYVAGKENTRLPLAANKNGEFQL